MQTQIQQPATGQSIEQPKPAQNGTTQNASPYLRPRANITETENGFAVQVEMPGVKKDGVEITFENGELTLVGRRTRFETKAELIYRESQQHDYRRVFEVDASIDAAHIAAQFEQGVLTLHLPKAEASKPRKIEVTGLN